MTNENTWPELGSRVDGFERALSECFDTVLPADLLVTLLLTLVAFGVLPAVGPWVLAGYALVLPSALVSIARFLTRAHAFRGELFEFSGGSRPFFRAAAPVLLALGLGAQPTLAVLHRYLRPFSDEHTGWLSVPYWALCFAALIQVEAGVRNAFANHTRCGTVRFESSLETGPLLWLYLTNLGAMALSLGLLVPWAELRLRRYRLSRLRVVEAA